MSSGIFLSNQARIFFHSGRSIAEKTGRETGSYWLVCEARTLCCPSKHFDYWKVIARINSLAELYKINGGA